MAVKDYMESEVAVAVAVTAAIFSPRVRRVVRRGLVYGVAGVLKAGDALSAAAQNAARAAEPPVAPAAPAATASTEAATVMGTTGSAISTVARRAVGAAQQVAASVVHTVQDVAEEAQASREGSQDLHGVEVRPDA